MPKRGKDNGFIHRLNATWKPHDGLMFYATWSRGFRPGGINRRGDIAPTMPDFLTNYELGGRRPSARSGGTARSITRLEGVPVQLPRRKQLHRDPERPDAKINGVETDVNYVSGGLTLNAAAAYTDAKTKGNICGVGRGYDVGLQP